jgi:hypothetical protein
MRTPALILLPFLAAGCSAPTLNYAGTIRPVTGTCDPTSQAILTRRDTTIIFAPAAGTIMLRGQLNAAETLTAGLTLTDPNKKPYQLTFQGTLQGKHIDGSYITPRCRYAVDLTLTGD